MSERIVVSNLSKSFSHEGKTKVVLNNISFSIKDESFTTVVGSSGCGKSTLLNIIAGIEPASSGSINFATSDKRTPRVGYVFQTACLLPWMSIMDNMLFVKPDSVDNKEFKEKAKYYLEMVNLGDELTKYPLQLSGGMQQRVGIARALAVEPDILLMDEPFSHLDELTAEKLRDSLLKIWEKTRKTILFVTHDLQEALQLGDRLMIFGSGILMDDISIELSRPRNITEKEFISKYVALTKRFFDLQHDREKETA